jgi:hypothetical protein
MATQLESLRSYLEAGHSITPVIAMSVFRVYRLAARIEELRLDGMDIDTLMKLDATGKTYAEYRLRKTVTLGAGVQVKRGWGIMLPYWVRRAKTATVVALNADAAMVKFQRGTRVEAHWLNQKELVVA